MGATMMPHGETVSLTSQAFKGSSALKDNWITEL